MSQLLYYLREGVIEGLTCLHCKRYHGLRTEQLVTGDTEREKRERKRENVFYTRFGGEPITSAVMLLLIFFSMA